MAALLNHTSQNADPQSKELQAAGRALGLHIDIKRRVNFARSNGCGRAAALSEINVGRPGSPKSGHIAH
jgi:hypothetical protein